MVDFTQMAECQRGDHAKCPGSRPAPPDVAGGVICDCSCHVAKPEPFEPERTRERELEQEFWRTIKDSNDAEDFVLYMRHFPAGVYAALARRKLAELRGAGSE